MFRKCCLSSKLQSGSYWVFGVGTHTFKGNQFWDYVNPLKAKMIWNYEMYSTFKCFPIDTQGQRSILKNNNLESNILHPKTYNLPLFTFSTKLVYSKFLLKKMKQLDTNFMVFDTLRTKEIKIKQLLKSQNSPCTRYPMWNKNWCCCHFRCGHHFRCQWFECNPSWS